MLALAIAAFVLTEEGQALLPRVRAWQGETEEWISEALLRFQTPQTGTGEAATLPSPAIAEIEETEPQETELPQESEVPEETPPPATAPEPAPTPIPTPTPEPTPSPEPIPEHEAKALLFPKTAVTNRTKLELDCAALLAEECAVKLKKGAPQILIIHTHGTEAYTRDSAHSYEQSDLYRTTDTAYNVVAVGDVLASELAAQGLIVVHDRGLYDYPSYTGSYTRSGAAVEQWLRAYPDIAVVIDLHRDALGSGEAVYKTRAELNGEASAQVMLLVGTGENGLEHPLWRENFKLALRLQDAMDKNRPTLCRPIELVNERYNQHYTTGSLILEVGSNGNTLPEALCAIRHFAAAAGPVFLSLLSNEV